MNPSISTHRIHNPYLGASPVNRLAPAQEPASPHETPGTSDAVTLGGASPACVQQSPAVLQGTATRLGVAVALGLSMWGAVTPVMAAAPPQAPSTFTSAPLQGGDKTSGVAVTPAAPQANASQQGAATPAPFQPVEPAVSLDRTMRKMKSQIDACLSQPQGFDQVLEGFGQGREGNCSAIAVIKASMQHFGTHALGNVEATPLGYRVTTRPGYTTFISFDELEQTSELEHFSSDDDRATAFATLCYATMAKGALLFELNGARTFKEALHVLGNPQTVMMDARLLGTSLGFKPIAPNPDGFKGHDGIIAVSDNHAVFVTQKSPGSTDYMVDHYGAGYKFSGTDTNRHPLIGAWGFESAPASNPAQP